MSEATSLIELDLALNRLRADGGAWGELLRRLDARTPLPGRALGIISDFDALACAGFDPTPVAPLIRRFYLETSAMKMRTVLRWRLPILGPLYARAASLVGQLSPPADDVVGWTPMTSQVADVPELGGPLGARLWRRRLGPDEAPFYTALVRPYHSGGRCYLQVALPYWFGHVSVVFRLENGPDRGFIGNAVAPRTGETCDRGVWLVPKVGDRVRAIRAPIARGERIELRLVPGAGDGGIKGTHESFVELVGVRRFLEMEYEIFPRSSIDDGR